MIHIPSGWSWFKPRPKMSIHWFSHARQKWLSQGLLFHVGLQCSRSWITKVSIGIKCIIFLTYGFRENLAFAVMAEVFGNWKAGDQHAQWKMNPLVQWLNEGRPGRKILHGGHNNEWNLSLMKAMEGTKLFYFNFINISQLFIRSIDLLQWYCYVWLLWCLRRCWFWSRWCSS